MCTIALSTQDLLSPRVENNVKPRAPISFRVPLVHHVHRVVLTILDLLATAPPPDLALRYSQLSARLYPYRHHLLRFPSLALLSCTMDRHFEAPNNDQDNQWYCDCVEHHDGIRHEVSKRTWYNHYNLRADPDSGRARSASSARPTKRTRDAVQPNAQVNIMLKASMESY
jgi:hypothetical protein